MKKSTLIKASPMPMTQEEIEAMISRKGDVRRIAKRLVHHSAPSKSRAKKSEKVSPIRISKSEMASIQKGGVLPSKLQERIKRSASDLTDEGLKKTYDEKLLPTQTPEKGLRGSGEI